MDVSGIIYMIAWINMNELLVAGDMVINNQHTYLAKMDAKNNVWKTVVTGDKVIPGPVTTFALDTDAGDSIFFTGNYLNGTQFLMKWTGSSLLEIQGFGSSTNIRGIQIIKLNSDHGSNDLLHDDHTLFVTGLVDIPQTGSYSGVLFNGLSWTPLLLTSKSNGETSTLSSLFTQRKQIFSEAGKVFYPLFRYLIS